MSIDLVVYYIFFFALLHFFFQPQALVDPVGALGEANLSEATMSFLFGALTGRISQFANGTRQL